MYCSYHLKFFCFSAMRFQKCVQDLKLFFFLLLKTKFKVKKNCSIEANEVNVYMILNLTKIMRYEGYIS